MQILESIRRRLKTKQATQGQLQAKLIVQALEGVDLDEGELEAAGIRSVDDLGDFEKKVAIATNRQTEIARLNKRSDAELEAAEVEHELEAVATENQQFLTKQRMKAEALRQRQEAARKLMRDAEGAKRQLEDKLLPGEYKAMLDDLKEQRREPAAKVSNRREWLRSRQNKIKVARQEIDGTNWGNNHRDHSRLKELRGIANSAEEEVKQTEDRMAEDVAALATVESKIAAAEKSIYDVWPFIGELEG